MCAYAPHRGAMRIGERAKRPASTLKTETMRLLSRPRLCKRPRSPQCPNQRNCRRREREFGVSAGLWVVQCVSWVCMCMNVICASISHV